MIPLFHDRLAAARAVVAGSLFLLAASASAAAKPDAEQLFVQRVLPVFKEKCFACHGDDPKKIKGDFVMLTREGLLKGGESEKPSIVPGMAEASPLYIAVTRKNEDLAMPPKENDKLTAEQVEYFKQWIDGGAPWPNEARMKELASTANKWSAEDGITVATSGGLSADWTNRKYKPENLWAYQPLKKPAVPSVGADVRRLSNSEGSQSLVTSSPTNPIDAFINAKLGELKLSPAPLADRRTLIRRVTYDLIGLPPTPEEVEAFIKDPLPDDKAFAAVVERLLASPHYGERWGQHWLDVVRYADSSGFANDYVRGNTWRYRDYVIRAFNNDKPYDQFVREQIAGDEIDATNSEMLIAAGFLRMGPWELTGMEVAKIARQRFLDDATDMVGQVFMGHMLQCARCHDHKFDPIPTRDYYSMQAVFATTQLAERDAPFLEHENKQGFEERKYLEQRRQGHIATLKELDAKSVAAAVEWFKEKKIDPTAWNEAVAEAKEKDVGGGKREYVGVFTGARSRMMAKKISEEQFPPKLYGFSPEDYGRERMARKGLERLKWEFERYQPIAFTVYDGRTPNVRGVTSPAKMPTNRMTDGELEETAILGGGDPFSPTLKVVPAPLSVVDKYTASYVNDFPKLEIPDSIEGRRLALAKWITHSQHPLTARVMVNRIWLWHFGQAIAGNPNNLGGTGKKPTHPELLDWLAATFVEKGWSVKAMHRLILSSEAYRRSSVFSDQYSVNSRKSASGGTSASLNTEQLITEYSLFKPRRLSAEEFRDSMLRVSGELNLTPGGIPARPEINPEAAMQPRMVMGTFAEAWMPSPRPEQRHRRSIYTLKIRGQLDPFMEVFNSPTPDLSCEAREASTVTPQVFSLFNSQGSLDRAVAFASRLKKEAGSREQIIKKAIQMAYGRNASAEETKACLAHWDAMTARHKTVKIEAEPLPKEVLREAVEENTGEKFRFTEKVVVHGDFVPDLKLADVDAETRGLAEVCLVLFNANEFAYVY